MTVRKDLQKEHRLFHCKQFQQILPFVYLKYLKQNTIFTLKTWKKSTRLLHLFLNIPKNSRMGSLLQSLLCYCKHLLLLMTIFFTDLWVDLVLFADLCGNSSQSGLPAPSNIQSETNSKMYSLHTWPFRICPRGCILTRWKITCKRIWRHNTSTLGSIFTASTSYLQSEIRSSLLDLSIDCLRHSQRSNILCWSSWYTGKVICALIWRQARLEWKGFAK